MVEAKEMVLEGPSSDMSDFSRRAQTSPVPFLVHQSSVYSSLRLRNERLIYVRTLNRLCAILQEKELTVRSFNKIFACEWVDNDTILLGTKCNHLLLLTVSTCAFKIIPLGDRIRRNFSTANITWGRSGIHSIAYNFSRTHFATGGVDPADCVIFTSDYKHVHTMIGHRDWIFGIAWVTDYHLVTGSRDCSVALWDVRDSHQDGDSVDAGGSKSYMIYEDDEPRHNKDFSSRVRDIKYCPDIHLVAALSTDGSIKLLDPGRNLCKVRGYYLPQRNDLVSMATAPGMIAVGGLSQVQIVDPRRRGIRNNVITFLSPDTYYGVRSLEFNNHILSYGTGRGKLVFNDLRWNGQPVSEIGSSMTFDSDYGFAQLSTSDKSGHVEHNHTFTRFFGSSNIRQAFYTHKWDPSGTRIFTAGGPLPYGLSGSYLSIWQ